MRKASTLALLALAAVAGCAKPPPPVDADGSEAGAVNLALAERHVDALACKEGDCSDWYRIAVPGKGELAVEVASEGAALSGLEVRVVDSEGNSLGDATGDSTDRARRVHSSVTGGVVLVDVSASDPAAQIPYSIRAKFTPAPPPRPPAARFETRRAAVLEVEGRAGAQMFVLLDAGTGADLRAGLRGKLIDGGKTLGSIVIQDVYADGSRARVEGTLAGAISPRTVAEIEVPVAPAAGAESPPEP